MKSIRSKEVTILILVLFGLAILIGTFSVGMAAGYRKARFSYAWSENYHKNFAGPRAGFMNNMNQDFSGGDFIGGHGAFGQIISIADSELVVRGKDNIEKIITVTSETDIRRFRDAIQASDLKPTEPIVVIGEPNDQGQIEAKFIRVMPMPASPALQRGEPARVPMQR